MIKSLKNGFPGLLSRAAGGSRCKRQGSLASGWLPVIAACLLLFTACNNSNPSSPEDKGPAKILQQPPYAALTDSIRRFPKDAGLYLRRGDLLSRNNQHEIAAVDFGSAWALRPDEETGLRYGSTLSILNRPAEAAKLLRDCIQKFPGDDTFKKMLGEVYTQSGNIGEALKLYDSMLEADSTDFESWYERGLLLEQGKDTAGAIASLRKAWSIQPINTYALELAHLYAENANKLSLQLCDEIIRKDSAHEQTDPFFIKGIYYSNTRQYNAAIVQFDTCIHRDWKFTDAYIEKGIAVFKQKKYEDARNVFQMAVTVSNTYPDAYFWIGRCYEAENRKTEAAPFYERAIGLDKQFTEAREALKRVRGT
ncbi:MAG: tetratricopeptide repeat protein [Puia sp.]|nr:tetratricopeptide repeat protein [Puia sp.]